MLACPWIHQHAHVLVLHWLRLSSINDLNRHHAHVHFLFLAAVAEAKGGDVSAAYSEMSKTQVSPALPC